MLHDNPKVMTVYIPWLAAALAAALELEGVHRLRRIMFGVHAIPPGARWLLLCALGMAGAIALSYTLIYVDHLLHASAVGYWLPWAVYLAYMTIIAERERQAQRLARPSLHTDPEDR